MTAQVLTVHIPTIDNLPIPFPKIRTLITQATTIKITNFFILTLKITTIQISYIFKSENSRHNN